MRGLSFRIAGSLYALRLADIGEVLPLATLRPVPGAAAAVAGLLNLHGRAVPVIDLALHCVERAEPVDMRTRLVMLAAAHAPLGLLLATTGDIVDLPPGAVQPCPLSNGRLPFMAGLGTWRGETLQWIDMPALRAAVRPALQDAEAHHA